LTKRMRLRNRKQGLEGVLKAKTSSVRANRDSFQEVGVARAVNPPKLSKVKPVVKKVENNNIAYVDFHRIDVGADADKEDTFLDGVPAVNAPQDLLINMNCDEDSKSACGD
jgi:hypothetical protein